MKLTFLQLMQAVQRQASQQAKSAQFAEKLQKHKKKSLQKDIMKLTFLQLMQLAPKQASKQAKSAQFAEKSHKHKKRSLQKDILAVKQPAPRRQFVTYVKNLMEILHPTLPTKTSVNADTNIQLMKLLDWQKVSQRMVNTLRAHTA